MSNSFYTYQPIAAEECMGDSLFKINNNNFQAANAIGELETRIQTVTGSLLKMPRTYSFYIQWTRFNSQAISWSNDSYEGTNQSYPGGTTFINIDSNPVNSVGTSIRTGLNIENTNLSVYTESNIGVDFIGYANYDGTNGYVNTQIAFDLSYDNGATWNELVNTFHLNNPSNNILAYGVNVPNAGASIAGAFAWRRPGNTTVKFRPKMRFQNPSNISSPPNNWAIYGNFNVHIQPINLNIF